MATDISLPTAVPDEWTVSFRDRDEEPRGGELPLYVQAVAARESLALTFWNSGYAPWARFGERLGAATIRLDRFPALDDIFTLWLWARREQGDEPTAHPAWLTMCRYVGEVRRGYWPDAEPLEHAVQAVFAALRLDTLASEPRRESEFLARAFALFDRVAAALAAGKVPHKDDMLADAPEFAVYFEQLRADRKLYREAATRADRYWARVPAAHHAGRSDRRVPLLVLRDPIAAQYKLWARRDPEAPGGEGYPLLLVEDEDGKITLSADPASRLRVGWLATSLSQREEAERGRPAPWFDGRDPKTGEDRFHGTICAYPEGGTELAMADVVKVLARELSLRRVRARRPRAAVAAGSAGALALAWILFGGVSKVPLHATKGAPLSDERVQELLRVHDGPGGDEFGRYALLIGASRYQQGYELKYPPRDVEAMRALLSEHYGYRLGDIAVLVDDGNLVDHSVAPDVGQAGLFAALEEFKDRKLSSRSSFLFYYSGHGKSVKGAGRDYGILQFPGYFRNASGREAWAFDMNSIQTKLRDYVASNHIFIVLDCCYSGWIGDEMSVERLDPCVTEGWHAPATAALTAGRRFEEATESKEFHGFGARDGKGGHGALTHVLLEGMSLGGGLSRPPADANGDGAITDEELALFVAPRVPSLVAATIPGRRQQPIFVRLDVHEPLSAKFLFVPRLAATKTPR